MDQNASVFSSRQEFELLTKRHVSGMWRTAYRMTGCTEAAADLTQEACLKAYRSFTEYESGTNYQAWIYRILTNLCRDFLRREARAPFRIWDNDEVDAAMSKISESQNCQPDAQLQNSQFYDQALDAMSRLEPELRMVVCLSMLEDMSYQEMANITDVPVGTVRSRLSRGRKILQDALKVYLVQDSKNRSVSFS